MMIQKNNKSHNFLSRIFRYQKAINSLVSRRFIRYLPLALMILVGIAGSIALFFVESAVRDFRANDFNQALDISRPWYVLSLGFLITLAIVSYLYIRLRRTFKVEKLARELAQANEALQRDIIERKRIETALGESEHKFRELFNNMWSCSVVYEVVGEGNDFIIKEFNKTAEKVEKFRSNEVIGRRVTEVFPGVKELGLFDVFRRVWRTGNPEHHPVTLYKDQRICGWRENYVYKLATGEIVACYEDVTERKRTEEALKESEEFSKMLLENAPNPIFVQNPDTSIRYVNPAWEKLTGYSSEEITGKKAPYPHWPKEKADEYLEEMQNSFGQGKSPSKLKKYQRKSGECYWAELSVAQVINKEGELKYIISSYIDVTERKKAEEALKTSEDFSATLREKSPNPILVINPDSSIGYVNPAFETLTGYSVDEVVGIKPPFPWWAAEDRSQYVRVFPSIGTGSSSRLERRMLNKAGKQFWVELSAAPITMNDGSKCYLSNWIDITERKEAEATNSQLASIVNSSDDAIFGTTLDGIITNWNKGAENIFGYTDSEIIGNSISRLVPSDYQHGMTWVLEKIRQGEHIDNFETISLKKDGKEIDISLTISPVYNAENRTISVSTIARDITEKRRLQEKYTNLVEKGNDGIVIIQDGLIKYVNPKMTQITGFPSGYSLNKSFIDFISPESREIAVDNYQKRISGKTVSNPYEYGLLDKEGKKIPVEVNVSLIQFESRPAIMAIIRDITERKKAEEEVRESEKKFRILAEQSPNMIFINTGSRIAYANKKCEEILGYSQNDFYSPDFDFITLIAPESRDLIMQNFLKRKQNQEIGSYEYTLITKEGQRIEAILSMNIIEYEKSKAFLGIVTDITERKKAEEEIRYRALLVDNVSDAIISTTLDSNIISWNKAAERIYGWKQEEVLGKKVRDLLHMEFPTGSIQELLEQLDKTGYWVGESIHRCKNSVPLIMSASISRFKDNTGAPIGNVGIYRDITKIKQIEAALRSSEEKYRGLVNNVKLGIFRSTPGAKGRFLEVNLAMEEITGYSRYELLKIDVCDLYVILKERGTFSEETVHYQGKIHREFQFKRKDGKEITVSVTDTAVCDDSGKVVYFDGILEDITEHKEVEKALRASEQRLKEAQTLGRIGSWEYVFGSQQIFWSDKMYELYKRDTSLGPPTFEELISLYPSKEAQKWQDIIKIVTETGKVVRHEMFTNLPGDATFFSYNVIGPLKDEAGHIVGLLGTIQDITERKQSEARALETETLKQLNKAKSELLANVSHELRTPLASIKGFVETLIEPDVKWSKKEQLDFLQSANQEADHLTFLIRDLLDMSRIDSGKMVLDKRYCQVNEVMDSVRSVISIITKKHNLQVNLYPDLPAVKVDKARIAQVITNLAENATKFSPEGSLINIEARADKDNLIISVRDEGEGISEEAMKNLFDRFYQAERVVSGKTRGTGLGLAICKGIVEAHRGKIWVESQSGKGSIFSFSIPVNQD